MPWLDIIFKLLKFNDYFYKKWPVGHFFKDVSLHNLSADALLNTHNGHG